MAWPYSQIKTAVTGDILTATDYNNEHQNHITNNDPTAINDSSATVTAMRTTTDPGESGTESLPTTLDGEIQRLRFAIVDLKGTTYWYQTPTKTLAQMLPLSGGTVTGTITMSGATIAMGAQKITGLANGTAATDAAAFGQIPTATSWASYTPTFVGWGTVANVSFFWKRSGDTLFIQGTVQVGTPTAVVWSMTLPGGITIDYTKCPTSVANTAPAGWSTFSRTAETPVSHWALIFADGSDTGKFFTSVSAGSSGAGFAKENGNYVNASAYVVIKAEIPIS